jgi:hypothetical protein
VLGDDAISQYRKPDILLRGHPEGFQIVPGEFRALANIPDTAEVAVVDLDAAAQTASWSMADLRANLPMAVDATIRTMWVATASMSAAGLAASMSGSCEKGTYSKIAHQVTAPGARTALSGPLLFHLARQ